MSFIAPAPSGAGPLTAPVQTFPEPAPGPAGPPSVPGAPVAAPAAAGWAAPESEVDLPRRSSTYVPTAAPTRRAGRALADSPVTRLQPRSVGQLLDAGFEVLRFRFRDVATVALAIALPLYAAPQVMSIVVGGAPQGGSDASILGNPVFLGLSNTQGDLAATLAWAYLAAGGLWLASMLVGVAMTHQVTGWLTGNDPSAGETLRFVARRAPAALAAWLVLLAVKAVTIGLTCGLATIVVIPLFSLAAPVLGAEGLGPMASIGRARRLANRRLGPLVGMVTLWALISSLIAGAVALGTAAVGSQLFGSELGTARVGQAIGVVLTLVLLVVQVAVTVLMYVDVRVRTEGLDLELDASDRFPVQERPAGVLG